MLESLGGGDTWEEPLVLPSSRGVCYPGASRALEELLQVLGEPGRGVKGFCPNAGCFSHTFELHWIFRRLWLKTSRFEVWKLGIMSQLPNGLE